MVILLCACACVFLITIRSSICTQPIRNLNTSRTACWASERLHSLSMSLFVLRLYIILSACCFEARWSNMKLNRPIFQSGEQVNTFLFTLFYHWVDTFILYLLGNLCIISCVYLCLYGVYGATTCCLGCEALTAFFIRALYIWEKFAYYSFCASSKSSILSNGLFARHLTELLTGHCAYLGISLIPFRAVCCWLVFGGLSGVLVFFRSGSRPLSLTIFESLLAIAVY